MRMFPSSDIQIVAAYSQTVGTSIINNTETIIVWNNKIVDQFGIMNTGTGEVTVPKSGLYLISAQSTLFTTFTVGEDYRIAISDSTPTVVRTLERQEAQATNAGSVTRSGTAIRRYDKDDIFTISVFQNTGGDISLGTGVEQTSLSIAYLGDGS